MTVEFMEITINDCVIEQINRLNIEELDNKKILSVSFTEGSINTKEKITSLKLMQNGQIISQYTDPTYILTYNSETSEYTITIFI